MSSLSVHYIVRMHIRQATCTALQWILEWVNVQHSIHTTHTVAVILIDTSLLLEYMCSTYNTEMGSISIINQQRYTRPTSANGHGAHTREVANIRQEVHADRVPTLTHTSKFVTCLTKTVVGRNIG